MSTQTPALPTAGTWIIEPTHSTVEVIARHLGLTKVRARFDSFEGKVVIAEDVLESTLDITIDAASVNTNNADRDAHLRSDDFLAADTHQAISFTSSSISGSGASFELVGDLTLAGVTKPVTLDLEYGGLTQDPWGNTRALFSASTTVDREAWGLTWNQALETGGVLVSKKLKVEVEVQLIEG